MVYIKKTTMTIHTGSGITAGAHSKSSPMFGGKSRKKMGGAKKRSRKKMGGAKKKSKSKKKKSKKKKSKKKK
jgi:hypothetical protein